MEFAFYFQKEFPIITLFCDQIGVYCKTKLNIDCKIFWAINQFKISAKSILLNFVIFQKLLVFYPFKMCSYWQCLPKGL